MVSNVKLNVNKPEGWPFYVRTLLKVICRTTEEETFDVEQANICLPALIQEINGDRYDATGGRFCLVICPYLVPNPKLYIPQSVQVGVFCPHAGKDLCQISKVSLHGALAYWAAVFC